MVSCSAYGCTNRSNRKTEGITFHKFPLNPQRKELWVKAVKRKNWDPSKYSCLCSAHFHENDIDRTSLSSVRIRHNAIPSIFPGFPSYYQKVSSATPSPLRMEARIKQELDSDESHVALSQGPATDFKNCSVKTESQDVDTNFPREETWGDPLDSKDFIVYKSEQSKEQMNLGALHCHGGSSPQYQVQTDTATNAFKQLKVEHLDASDYNTQFDVSVCKESEDGIAEEVTKSELMIENDGLADRVRFSLEDSGFQIGSHQGYTYADKLSHLGKFLSYDTYCSYSTQNNIKQQDCYEFSASGSVLKIDEVIHTTGKNHYNFSKGKNVLKQIDSSVMLGPTDKSEIHTKPYIDNNEFLCSICNKAFKSKKSFRNHSKIHTGKKSFVCSTCNKAFMCKSYLKKHSLVHTGETPFVCSTCNKPFATKSNLKHHFKIHTRDNINDRSKYKKTCAVKKNRKKYSQAHSGEKTFLCSICSKLFGTEPNLQKHYRTHARVKEFQCLTCNKTFTRKDSLQKHCKLHTGEKPYLCSTCDKRFSRKDHLKNHFKGHINEENFECSICNRKFTWKSSFRKHSVVHTGEKPFVCSTCNRTFARKDDLRKHSLVHSEDRAFQCSICNKSFKERANLKNHFRKSHQMDV